MLPEFLMVAKLVWPDIFQILLIPVRPVACRKWPGPIDRHRNLQAATRSRMKLQPGKGLTTLGQNRHDGPVAAPEHPGERLFVDTARRGRGPWMRMDPDPSKLGRPAAGIDLGVEELGHRLVVKRHRDWGAFLPDQHKIFQVEQILGVRDGETADFRRSEITQKQQFGPRQRTEPQCRAQILPGASLCWIPVLPIHLHGHTPDKDHWG